MVQKEYAETYLDKDIAVIGFWRNTPKNTLQCYHYFYVPNPMKRAIKQVGASVLYQLLYTGSQGEVFFFFSDPENKGNEKVNLAILDTNIKTKSQSQGISKKVENNCLKVIQLTGEAVLTQHIMDLNTIPLKDQKALPNPTFVQNKHGSFVAFTAYYM